jgi:pilus assembly protein CpaC
MTDRFRPAPAQEPSPQASALIVPINGTIKLQMSKKQKIRTVSNPKDNAINIRTVVGDPTTILIIGQQPDVTRIELEDTDGNKENYEIIVQADVEYLRTQMKRAVPTANITIIPTSNNTVLLTGTVTRAEDTAVIRGLVQSLGFKYIDGMRVGGVQQVQLDVIIVQVSRSDLRNLTFNLLGQKGNTTFGSTVGGAVGSYSMGGLTGGASGSGGTGGGGSGSGGGITATPGTGTNLVLGFVRNAWGFQHFLEALRQNGMAKLLAEPRLVTLSGRPAYFNVGGQQAVPMTGSFGGTGVSFAPFGTMLSFVPIVLGNGRIHLEVSPSVSTLDAASGVNLAGSTTVVPGRAMTFVNTTVELEAGQTFVLGGLIQHTTQATTSKVPCLGDLPWLGTFFRSVQYQDTEQEVLVIVTPWLVDPMSCAQRPKMLPGEETRRPDDFELFLEGIIEAPRGPRQVWQNHHYVPAYKNSPSATVFPCGGNGYCGVDGCGPDGNALPPAGDPPVNGLGAANAGAMVPPGNLMSAPTAPPAPAPFSTPAPASELPAATGADARRSMTPATTAAPPTTPAQPIGGATEAGRPTASTIPAELPPGREDGRQLIPTGGQAAPPPVNDLSATAGGDVR